MYRRGMRMNLNRNAIRLLGVLSVSPFSLSAQGEAPIAADARIVALGGSVTETVFALGFGSQVVAVDESSLFPESVTELPQAGYYRTLSAEGLLSLRPDVVIGSSASGPPPALEMLRAAGIRVELIEDPHHPDEIPGAIERIAAILGVPERGREMAATVRSDFERAEVLRDATGELSAVFVWSRGGPGLQVAGRNTGAHTMLEVAGIRNAAEELDGYQPLNAEAMVLADPDILIVPSATAEGLGGLDAILRMPGVATTTAARMGNVVIVDLLAFVGFGPRSGEALISVVNAAKASRPNPIR